MSRRDRLINNAPLKDCVCQLASNEIFAPLTWHSNPLVYFYTFIFMAFSRYVKFTS